MYQKGCGEYHLPSLTLQVGDLRLPLAGWVDRFDAKYIEDTATGHVMNSLIIGNLITVSGEDLLEFVKADKNSIFGAVENVDVLRILQSVNHSLCEFVARFKFKAGYFNRVNLALG